MSQSTRDNLIMVAVVLAVVGGTSVLVYLPQNRVLEDVRTQVAKHQIQLTDSAKRTSVVPHMVRQVEQMKVLYRNFDRKLPQQKELGGFLREISSNLSQEQLTDQVIEPGTPSREQHFHRLPIILRFKGSYLSLASFLKRLDDMTRLTQVEKLSIAGKNAAPGEELSIEVHMNIYFTES